MKVLLWATSLQADILGLAFRLDDDPTCDVLIITEHAGNFLRSPIARFRPLRARILDRTEPTLRSVVERFRPEVVVCDNHFPPFDAAPRVCTMWHGLGWKARPSADLPTFYRHVRRLTGTDPRASNPRFLAQCYHERDRQWRISQWGLTPDSCVVVGSCFADLLRGPPPYSKADLASEYELDLSRQTLLVNISWHYGRIFPGTWQKRWFAPSPFEEDLAFLRQLFERATEHGANVLFCMHDRKRYEPAYLEAMHQLARDYGKSVCVRHKDEHPDNWADLSIADAMISNLSSFMTFFYQLGKPSVHLCPPADANSFRYARYSSSRLRGPRHDSSAQFWMNDPHDNGGMSAHTVEEALAAVSTALQQPDCCREKAKAWLAEHVVSPPESASTRLKVALEQMSRAS